ncbi:two component transcriptional regulator, LytTR family [Fibrisoma limi BUZ 3]|uniref:Two component transcriptional regulator, LytTR family n=1 Tax=Fibrisoma limi BUZ 3 TaxID=1185876 RepID=I2GLM2_9BACT|nr:response regulator [Fibrisoma limi]CCH54798.1 two component transcriptional regulator, LytTR family [Fibrisoma limi BUZ 3]
MDPINILIVEDEAIISMDLSHRLSQMGYQVVAVADNGPRALALYQEYPIDLALLDIHILGEWDGIETARRMRQVKQSPLIFLTGLTDNDTFERARTVSPSAYITKPFNDFSLRSAIDLAIQNFALSPGIDDLGTVSAGNGSHTLPEGAEQIGKGELMLHTKEYVFIKQNYRFTKFRIDDVLYLQSEGNYTDIITKESKYTLRLVLGKVLEKLQTPDVVRTHRSYAVNLRHVDSFSEHEIYIGSYCIPVGRSYRDEFMKGFEFR